jgi:hypothetical protein
MRYTAHLPNDDAADFLARAGAAQRHAQKMLEESGLGPPGGAIMETQTTREGTPAMSTVEVTVGAAPTLVCDIPKGGVTVQNTGLEEAFLGGAAVSATSGLALAASATTTIAGSALELALLGGKNLYAIAQTATTTLTVSTITPTPVTPTPEPEPNPDPFWPRERPWL